MGAWPLHLFAFVLFTFKPLESPYNTVPIEMNLAMTSLSGPKVCIACWTDDLVSGDVPLLLDQIPFLLNPHVSSVCSWHPIIDIIVCAVDPLFVRKKVVTEVLNETEAERSHTIFPFVPISGYPEQGWDVVRCCYKFWEADHWGVLFFCFSFFLFAHEHHSLGLDPFTTPGSTWIPGWRDLPKKMGEVWRSKNWGYLMILYVYNDIYI